MWEKQRKGWITGLFLAMLVVLTGCASGTAHVTVNTNGSIDIAASLALDSRVESLVGGKIEEQLTERLQDAGIELQRIENREGTEYRFIKSYASFEELKASRSKLNVVDAKVTTTRNWFYSKLEVQAQPKFSTYTDQIMDSASSLDIPKPLLRIFMQKLAVDFKLTLPVDLFGDNNATVDEGRTLSWHITLADDGPLEAVVYVPKIRNILIAASIVVMVLIIAVIVLFRRRRKAKKQKR